MDAVQDFEDFLELLDRHHVRYLIIGGLAFIFHAKPRFTKDIDVWLDPEPDNLARANAALADFGCPYLLNVSDEDEILQLGGRSEPDRPAARGGATRIRRRLAPARRGHVRTGARALDRHRRPAGGQGADRPPPAPGGCARAAPGARAETPAGMTASPAGRLTSGHRPPPCLAGRIPSFFMRLWSVEGLRPRVATATAPCKPQPYRCLRRRFGCRPCTAPFLQPRQDAAKHRGRDRERTADGRPGAARDTLKEDIMKRLGAPRPLQEALPP